MALTGNSHAMRSRMRQQNATHNNFNKLKKPISWKAYYSRIKNGLIIGSISMILILQISKLNEYANKFDTSNTSYMEDEWSFSQPASLSENNRKMATKPDTKQSDVNVNKPKQKSKSEMKVENRLLSLSILLGSPKMQTPSYSYLNLNTQNKTSVALCTFLKNDKMYIKEWIDFHLGIGFDNIYVYDTSITNELKNTGRDRVTIKHWSRNEKGRLESSFKQHCLQSHGIKHNWIVFLHGNEFLVLKQHENVQELLLEYNDMETLILNRYVFGSLNSTTHEAVPVTLRFLYRQSNLYTRLKGFINMKFFSNEKMLDVDVEKNVPLHHAVVHQYTKTRDESIAYGCSVPIETDVPTSRCPLEK